MSVPDRWLFCPRIGSPIEANESGGSFVPLKTLLDDRYDDKVHESERWNASMLLEQTSGDLGMLIDLTKSTRYYDPAPLVEQGIKVVKVQCDGHDGPPTVEQVSRFQKVCEEFWNDNPDKFIGVHCTHGFNRTGFMICAFLEREQAIDDAINNFITSRPPGIYKEAYTAALLERAGDPEASQPWMFPELKPSWCLGPGEYIDALRPIHDLLVAGSSAEGEPADTELGTQVLQCATEFFGVATDTELTECLRNFGWVDEQNELIVGGIDQDSLNGLATAVGYMIEAREGYDGDATVGADDGNSRVRKQSDESDRACADGAAFAFPTQAIEIAPPPLQGQLRRRCRELIGGKKGTGFTGAQPVSLDADNLQFFVNSDYWVSWKADGTRYLLLIHEARTYLIGRDNTVFKVKSPGIWFPRPDWSMTNTGAVYGSGLLDGELVIDTENVEGNRNIKRPRFLIYDVIMLNGEDYRRKTYDKRLGAIKDLVIKPRDWHRVKYKVQLKEPFSLRFKYFEMLNSEGLRKMTTHKDKHVMHETDGYVFAANDQDYEPGTCTSLLKWKPPELNSFDFLFRVTKEPSGLTVARLMVSHGADEIEFNLTGNSVIKINPGNDPAKLASADRLMAFDGKIIETTLVPHPTKPGESKWRTLRVRTDKTHPNSYNTCRNVLKSIKEGVTMDQITTTIRNQEYAKRKRRAEIKLSAMQDNKRYKSYSAP